MADLFGAQVAAGGSATGAVQFVPLAADHLFDLEVQDSQRSQYGRDPLDMTREEAEALADNPGCYAAIRRRPNASLHEGGRGEEVIACLIVGETFPGKAGVALALLGKDLGRDHLAVTRFARDVVIGQSRLARIEAIVRCADPPAELGPGQLPMMTYCLQHPTPQVRWAIAVGLFPVAVLRKFGAASETHMLLERIS